jgi:hypothetical protein
MSIIRRSLPAGNGDGKEKPFQAALYVPENYNPETVGIKTELRDYAAYLLNLIHWRTICWRADEEGYVHLQHDYLVKVIPSRALQEIRYRLTNNEGKDGDSVEPVVLWDRTAIWGKKAFGFKLSPAYRSVRRMVCTNPELNKKIEKLASEESKALLPVHRWLREKLDLLDYDTQKAHSIIATLSPDDDSTLSPKEYRRQRMDYWEKLAAREHFLVCDPYGRVHTPITALEKDLRPCLSVQGKHLVGLDLKNSQPLMAGLAARRFCTDRLARSRMMNATFDGKGHVYGHQQRPTTRSAPDALPDVEEYIRCCEEGRFYESFEVMGLDREAIKKLFFEQVFFGRNTRRKSQVQKAFEKQYPSVAEMIFNLKKKAYQRAAWTLQSLESTIFIYFISARIMKERPLVPIFTIHDSILTIPSEAEFVRSVIMDVFGKLKVTPALSEETYE